MADFRWDVHIFYEKPIFSDTHPQGIQSRSCKKARVEILPSMNTKDRLLIDIWGDTLYELIVFTRIKRLTSSEMLLEGTILDNNNTEIPVRVVCQRELHPLDVS